METASSNTQTQKPRLWIVLIHPDIPQNTGNIARLCMVSDCGLVLVRPLGFRLTDRFLERSGMDYWHRLKPVVLDSIESFQLWARGRRVFCLSSKASKTLYETRFVRGDVLCFGSESHGLPPEFLSQNQRIIKIPMKPGERCLNVATAAGVATFEALRQIEGW